jgi:hypothetical protein
MILPSNYDIQIIKKPGILPGFFIGTLGLCVLVVVLFDPILVLILCNFKEHPVPDNLII